MKRYPARKFYGSNRTMTKKLFLIAIALLAVFGVRFWYGYANRGVDAKAQATAKELAEKIPSVKPIYDAAMADGRLTLQENVAIASEAKKALESERIGEE